MPKIALPTEGPRERAFLVGIERPDQEALFSVSDSLNELRLLAATAGLSVVGATSQRLRRPDPKTYLGSGKVQTVVALASDASADLVLFDDELSPRHQRELEAIFGDEFRLVDRTALILDIFALHAHTREGALQVELAQYEYRLPRLTRAWTHLARQAGGGGGRTGSAGGVGLRGPGETQLEVDRREIRRRISILHRELDKVRAHRKRYRLRRRKAEVSTVALVGYTNAGKSTLLNRLSGAGVFVADQLFATLDPTTRRVDLGAGRQALMTDTVGFIQKLPTTLVAAFRATLEEIGEADLLLHVVDVTHPNAREQAKAVLLTLNEIEIEGIPIVTALNKIDSLQDPYVLTEFLDEFDRAVPISARTGEGIPSLLASIERELFDTLTPVHLRLPHQEGRLANLISRWGVVDRIEHTRQGIRIDGQVPNRLLGEMRAFQIHPEDDLAASDDELSGTLADSYPMPDDSEGNGAAP